MKFSCEETSDLPKVKNYKVKTKSKNYDLPKAIISAKTSNFNFPKVTKITKINCPELCTVTSNFLDFHGFKKRGRERERELIPYKEVCSFLFFHIPTLEL